MLARMPAEAVRKLFTVEEYDRMVEVGILTKYDRVELIEGEILEMVHWKPAFCLHGSRHHASGPATARQGYRPCAGSRATQRLYETAARYPLLKPRVDYYSSFTAPKDITGDRSCRNFNPL
jgi:hypothetical protein